MTNKATRNIAPIKGVKKGELSIILLSAGSTTRMKSYGPRPLIQITHNVSLIEHQLNVLNTVFPSSQIIMVCGDYASQVMNNTPDNIIKVENERFADTNVSRSMGIGLRAATMDRVLFIYGDLLFNHQTLKNMTLDTSSILIDNSKMFSEESVGCTYTDGHAEHLMYDIPNKWVQIAFIADKELSLLKTCVWDKEKEKLFGFEVLNEIIEGGGNISCQSPKGMKVIDIDTTKDLQRVSDIL